MVHPDGIVNVVKQSCVHGESIRGLDAVAQLIRPDFLGPQIAVGDNPRQRRLVWIGLRNRELSVVFREAACPYGARGCRPDRLSLGGSPEQAACGLNLESGEAVVFELRAE